MEGVEERHHVQAEVSLQPDDIHEGTVEDLCDLRISKDFVQNVQVLTESQGVNDPVLVPGADLHQTHQTVCAGSSSVSSVNLNVSSNGRMAKGLDVNKGLNGPASVLSIGVLKASCGFLIFWLAWLFGAAGESSKYFILEPSGLTLVPLCSSRAMSAFSKISSKMFDTDFQDSLIAEPANGLMSSISKDSKTLLIKVKTRSDALLDVSSIDLSTLL
ncbi:hypothetical protein WICPIJ_004618 [Wickerhamomyces pijperi]|uniref:Uncharacterized protein n=1 Tax=Wickerhamomyces pijperi TaxID=599730 RepID=A0A9P8Q7E4_WICPI|nr:hypothetical protein WICPIJ_004618 [Wickerhamomyces pijperi]